MTNAARSRLMEWMTGELTEVASVVDSLDHSTPTLELMEVGDAIQFALVRLRDWGTPEPSFPLR